VLTGFDLLTFVYVTDAEVEFRKRNQRCDTVGEDPRPVPGISLSNYEFQRDPFPCLDLI
jgi:hypothetical protein